MKTFLLGFAVLSCFLPAVAASAEEGQLHPCTDGPDVIDIEKVERLPFGGSGTTYEFKLPPGSKSISFEETKRRSRIATEISAVIKAIADSAITKQPESVQCANYTQKYPRSTIKVTATSTDDKVVATRTFVAGPEEHWYLSADMPISNIKQLTYDSSTGDVVEKEKPASFYLGINWQFGDVFSDYGLSEAYKNISLKMMLRASSRPSESYGIGIGYSFDAVDLFVARLRTKDDGNIGGKDLGFTDTTVVGLSFNISKGIAWMKN